jgi:hypothetical protein
MNRGSQPTEIVNAATSAGLPQGQGLSWAPPQLSAPISVDVVTGKQSLVLDSNRDYRIVMPSSPVSGSGGLTISGGHNVVLIGGEIRVPTAKEAPDSKLRRGLYLKGQTGTVHIEGLHIAGADLAEGIDLDQRFGATVQLENIRIERTRGSYTTNHADIIQAWAGPAILRVDRLTGSSDYQGFFMLPLQHFEGQIGTWDLRRVDLTAAAGSGFMLWKGANDKVTSQNVYIRADDRTTGKLFWPDQAAWPGVVVGSPPGGEFVPAGAAGIGYVSPGYGSSSQPLPSPTGQTAIAPGGGTAAGPAISPSPTVASGSVKPVTDSPVVGAVPVCGSGKAPTTYQHVVWIWMQNKRYESIVGAHSAPYLNQIAAACGLATDYVSDVHRSLPNALAATSGSTQAVTTNSDPAAFRIGSDNIFRQVRASGGTARTYVEGMPHNCALEANGTYVPKHNPAAYFTGADDRAACLRDDVPFTQFERDLACGVAANVFFRQSGPLQQHP